MSTGGSRSLQVSVLAVIAAGLTIAAMFVPYLEEEFVWSHTSELEPDGEVFREIDRLRFSHGLWGTDVTPPEVDNTVGFPMFGIVFAAIAFALAAGALLVRLRRSAGRFVLLAGAAAAVTAVSMLVISTLPRFTADWAAGGGDFTGQVGIGGWLLLAAAMVALVAAGFALPTPRDQRPSGQSGPDTEPIAVVQEAVIRWVPPEEERQ